MHTDAPAFMQVCFDHVFISRDKMQCNKSRSGQLLNVMYLLGNEKQCIQCCKTTSIHIIILTGCKYVSMFTEFAIFFFAILEPLNQASTKKQQH